MKEFQIGIFYGNYCSASAFTYVNASSLEEAEKMAKEQYPNNRFWVREIKNDDPYNGCYMFS